MVDLEDAEDEELLPELPKCCDFIHAARTADQTVFVHCTAGVSRSAAVVVAYIVAAARWTVDDALAALKRARPWVRPNRGFMRQLREWEAAVRTRDTPATLAWRRPAHDDCPLCLLQCRGEWHEETPAYVVLDCDSCDDPMVVLRGHGDEHAGAETERRMRAALAAVANRVFGRGGWAEDRHRRTIPGHVHWHARSVEDTRVVMARVASRL